MSSSYWGIVGYGWTVDYNMLDIEKCALLLSSQIPNFDASEYINEEAFDLNEISFSDMLYYENSGEEEFIMYSPRFPWLLNGFEKSMTQDDLDNILAEALLKITKDNITKEDLIAEFDFINTYGCG